MAREQHAKDAIAIQELERQNKKLSKDLENERAAAQTRDAIQTEEPPSKLERSSSEAYAGFVIAIFLAVLTMTWQLRLVLWLIVCVIIGDVAWRSPATYLWNKWAKRLLAISLVGIVAWLGWINVQGQIRAEELPVLSSVFLDWGVIDAAKGLKGRFATPITDPVKIEEGSAASYVIVDGDLLAKTKYAKSYKIVAVCFFYDGAQDVLDINGISKSGLFDIDKGRIYIRIPWSDQYIRRVARGDRGTNYVLLLVPSNVSPGKFDSLREAIRQGAVRVQGVAGPP